MSRLLSMSSGLSGWLGRVAVLLALALSLASLAPTQFAAADVLDQACQGAGANSSTCKSRSTTNPVVGSGGVLTRVVDILGVVAGVMAIIVIIFGGIKYITSGGDPGKTANAKNTIIYGIIGLLVVIFARIMVGIVVSRIK